MSAQCVMRVRVSSCLGVAVAAGVPFCVPFSVPVLVLVLLLFWAVVEVVMVDAVATEAGKPRSSAAARRTSGGEEEMRSSGQKEGVGRARRACRAQVRQRFECGGAEGEGASHLGLNWMRVDDVAWAVSLLRLQPFRRGWWGGGEGRKEGGRTRRHIRDEKRMRVIC